MGRVATEDDFIGWEWAWTGKKTVTVGEFHCSLDQLLMLMVIITTGLASL